MNQWGQPVHCLCRTKAKLFLNFVGSLCVPYCCQNILTNSVDVSLAPLPMSTQHSRCWNTLQRANRTHAQNLGDRSTPSPTLWLAKAGRAELRDQRDSINWNRLQPLGKQALQHWDMQVQQQGNVLLRECKAKWNTLYTPGIVQSAGYETSQNVVGIQKNYIKKNTDVQ